MDENSFSSLKWSACFDTILEANLNQPFVGWDADQVQVSDRVRNTVAITI
jgi:hypothetical protein